MKHYNDYEFPVRFGGESDVAMVHVVGSSGEEAPNHFDTAVLLFEGDGAYKVHCIYRKTDENVFIGEHYSLVKTFKSWADVYDDENKVLEASGEIINIYNSGCYTYLIEVINPEEGYGYDHGFKGIFW